MPTTWSIARRPTPSAPFPWLGHEAGRDTARVVAAVDERVDRVAVGGDRRQLDAAELVLDHVGLGDAARAALDGLTVGSGRVGDGQGDVLDAVAVLEHMLRDLVVAVESGGEDEADVALLDHVGRAVADAGLGPRVRGQVEAERVLVEVGGLLGVADPELEVIPALDRHEVGHG